MGTIRNRNGKFQAQVRRLGTTTISKTFMNKKEAMVWVRSIEARLDAGEINVVVPKAISLGDIMRRYSEEITPQKKGRQQELRRLCRLLRDSIASTPLSKLNGSVLAQFRDRRIKDGIRAAQYDLILIRHALKIARMEWGINLINNPMDNVRIPNGIRRRQRRLQEGEWQSLATASKQCRNHHTWPLVQFAVATGMRRGEMLSLTWGNVNLQERLLFLPDTKNGNSRSVPLTQEAISVLSKQDRSTDSVFVLSDCAARHSWDRLVKRAGIDGLRFHDLRHEAISRFFEMGLSMPQVALISGHKDPRMLFRYTHLRAADILKHAAFTSD